MDLFTLVARLTLDQDEYNSALEAAERKAHSSDLDVEGEVTADDQYSDTLEEAEGAADEAELDAKGELTAQDEYTDTLAEAEGDAEDAELDADGDLTATDEYSADLGLAEDAASGADLDVDGELDAEDTYSDVLSGAESDASSANLDVHGDITGDSSDYNAAIDDAAQGSDLFGQHFSDMAGTLANALTAAGVVAIINQISNAFQQAISQTAGYADEVDKGAQAMDISRDAYQRWRYVLGLNGASIQTVTKGMQVLRRSMGETGEMTDDVAAAFDEIGIDPSQYTDVETFFDDVMDALADYDGELDRSNLVTAIFGRGGTALNAMLNTGSEGIAALKQEAEDLGLIMTDDAIAAGVGYGDAISRMDQAVAALRGSIVEGLFPVLTDAANMVTGIISFLNGRTREISLSEQFEDIEQSMNSAFAEAAGNEAEAMSLITRLREMSDSSGRCATNFEEWQRVANRLIELCPDLAAQINTVNGEFSEQNGTLEENVRAWYRAVRQQALMRSVENKQQAVTDAAERLAEKQVAREAAERRMTNYGGQAREYAVQALRRAQSLGFADDSWTAERIRSYENTEDLLNDLYNGGFFDLTGEYATDEQMASLRRSFEEAYGSEMEEARTIARLDAQIEAATNELNAAMNTLQQYTDAVMAMVDEISHEGEETPRARLGADGLTLDTGTTDVDADAAQVNAGTVVVNGGNWTDPGNPHATDDSDPAGLGGVGNRLRRPHAKGLYDVPYDDYSALLHRDEMVLTPSQARDYRDGYGSLSADVVAAIEGMRNDLQHLQLVVGERAFGGAVVDYSGRRLTGYIGEAEDKAISGYGWG